MEDDSAAMINILELFKQALLIYADNNCDD